MPSFHPAFYQCSPRPNPRPPTLNAIPPDPAQAQHRADNLAACLELRDLGLALARAAAARVLAAREQAPATPETPDTTQTAKHPDPDLAFARHSRGVRQSVELWERITNNTFARRPYAQPSPKSSSFDPEQYLDDLDDLDLDDPPPKQPAHSEADRCTLYEAVANLALLDPTHTDIPESLNATITQTLIAHPNDHVSANFARICQAYGITPDRSRLMPHLESQLRPPDRDVKLE